MANLYKQSAGQGSTHAPSCSMRCPEELPGAGTWLTSYSLLKVSTKFHGTNSSEKVPTKTREVLMGVGDRVASVIMLTFTKRPGPHADTAWAVVG